MDHAGETLPPAAQKVRIAWPDAARGMAIVLVVLHHAVIYSDAQGLASPWWVATTEMLRTMRMPLFFLAAGLFAGKWVTGEWRALFKNKVLLFAWVFVVWVLIRWVVLNLVPGVDSETGIWQLPLHLLWPVGGWFIFVLAIFFVLARLTIRVPRALQLATATGASVIWFGLQDPIGNNGWDGVPTFYVFFLLGCHWRALVLEFGRRLTPLVGVALVTVWVGSYLVLANCELENAPVISFLLRLLGLAAGIALARGLERIEPIRRLGQSTLPIYLSHTLWIFVAVWAATELVGEPSLPAMTIIPVIVGLGGLGLSYLLGRVAPKIHAQWLFTEPAWLRRFFDKAWKAKT
jgi:uncharacterized membrane protein YcfT